MCVSALGCVVRQMTQQGVSHMACWTIELVCVCVWKGVDVSAAGDIMQAIQLSATQRFHLENEMQHHRSAKRNDTVLAQ